MSSGSEGITLANATILSTQNQSMQYEKKRRRNEVIMGLVAGIFGTLLAAGGIGLIVWVNHALQTSSPTTATGFKGVAGCLLIGVFGAVGGTGLAIAPLPMIISCREQREKDRKEISYANS